MQKQKKKSNIFAKFHELKLNNQGITLIALVISIIVMLILAGASLNVTVGENGIISRAQSAVKAQELAQTKEELEYMFFDYNVGNSESDIASWLESKKPNEIDDFTFWRNEGEDTFSYLITKNGIKFYVAKDGDYYYATETQTNLDSIGAGITIATQDGFDASSGKMTFDLTDGEKASLYFSEVVTGEFNFDVRGGTVDVYITQNMNLTNINKARSALEIAPSATLNLHLSEGITLNVDSGYGTDANGNTPGLGGYAGIHVPVGATLNLYGKGTIKAIGGDAGDAEENTTGGYTAGGGGAGAGIGGNGGNGGAGIGGVGTNDSRYCENGEDGEDCGNVNIYNSVKVYAYGGAGGSGGINIVGASGGAGGYPAAGIGGGGAGGAGSTCCTGAGGYTGGGASNYPYRAVNGSYGGECTRCGGMYWGGGGYFSGATGMDLNSINVRTCFGGMGGTSWWKGHRGGDGGNAGKGGIIKTSENAQIYAYNGNRYTDGTDYNSGLNQCPIYLQDGKSPARYEVVSYATNTSSPHSVYGLTNGITLGNTSEQITNLLKTGYVNKAYETVSNSDKIITMNSLLTNVNMSNQGIGSGAGYVEVSNGTYAVDSSKN